MSTPKTKTKYVSKGERPNVKAGVTKAVKRDRSAITKHKMIQKAWAKGQNPWVTIPNPDANATNKRFIRVRANIEFGDPREFVTVLGRAQ